MSEQQYDPKDLERLKKFCYMDDDFMTACLEKNIEAAQLVLRIVLRKSDLIVQDVKVQHVLKNLQGRSAIIDVHATDSEKKEYDIEIQRADAGAGAKRARHNSSLLDAQILKPGQKPEDMPDSYVIFITENDVLEGNQPVYPIDRYIAVGNEKVLFQDGSHILYVNGKYRGDDEIGRLMHDFSCENPDDMNYAPLADKARYFKQDKEGIKVMCKMMEDMRNEAAEAAELNKAKKTAAYLIKKGKMSLEEIAEANELPIEVVKELEAEIMQLA